MPRQQHFSVILSEDGPASDQRGIPSDIAIHAENRNLDLVIDRCGPLPGKYGYRICTEQGGQVFHQNAGEIVLQRLCPFVELGKVQFIFAYTGHDLRPIKVRRELDRTDTERNTAFIF